MSTTIGFETPTGIGIDDADQTPSNPDLGLAVYVIFTSVNQTLKALEKAQQMARPAGANVFVVAVQVVPHPLQLDQPPVSFDFLIKQFEEKADGQLDNAQISVYLCRDQEDALKRVLIANCPVVIGVRKRWFVIP